MIVRFTWIGTGGQKFLFKYFGIIICNLAGFRKCLAEHTAHNLVTFLVIAYHTGAIE